MTLIEGDCQSFVGDVDLVLTNLYAPLPQCLVGVPILVTHFANRKARCEDYVRAELIEVSAWGRNLSHRMWAANMPRIDVALTDLVEEEDTPGRGWFPLELPLRLLRTYAQPSSIVCDPCMGRGTVGRACKVLGHRFVGIDIDPQRVALARDYIG